MSLKHGAWLAPILFLAFVGSTYAVPADPPSNFVPSATEITQACSGGGTSASCENLGVSYLNKARAAVGLGPYAAPGDFITEPPANQAVVLIHDDRTALGELDVSGLDSRANDAAQQGVASGGDPSYPAGFPAGLPYGSNFGGGPNILFAYLGWMWQDGPGTGGTNSACNSNGAACWAHRHNVLMDGSSPSVALGVAAGATTFAMLEIDTAAGNGGGTSGGSGGGTTGGNGNGGNGNPVSPPAPTTSTPTTPAAPVTTTTAAPFQPPGLKYHLVLTYKPDKSCGSVKPGVIPRGYQMGEKIYQTATVKHTLACKSVRFVAWQGAAGCGKKPVCKFVMNGPKSAKVVFTTKKAKK